MYAKLPADVLLALFEAANSQTFSSNRTPDPYEGVYDEILDREYATPLQFTTLLEIIGVPSHTIPDILKYLDVHPVTLFRNGNMGATKLGGTTAFLLADVARVLIFFERIGFRSNPEPVATTVYEQCCKKALLTAGEVDCLWYEEEKNQCSIFIRATEASEYRGQFLSPNGYHIQLTRRGLRVTGPSEILHSGEEIISLAIE